MAITEIELAEKVKSKYPQYKDIDDTELVSLVLDRYPEYSTQLGEKEYSKNILTNSAKTLVSGGVQAAINSGAGMLQSYSMLLGDKSDTSEEAVEEYASQRRVKQRKGGSRMAKGKILAHRKRKNEVIQSLNENSHRLRTLANSTDERFNIDPEFANSFGGQVLKGFGQMIGNIGVTTVGTRVAGPAGGFAAAVGTIAPQMVSEAVSDAESTLGKSYMDMTEEEKEGVALSSASYAVFGTALEFAPVARIPWVKNFLRGKTKVPAGVLKSPSVRREIAKGFAAEGFTEAAQGQLLDSLARATFDDDRELMSWDVLRQRFNEFAVGGVVGGGTSGGIATVQKAARGELFKPKERKERPTDGTKKQRFDISYTDKNTGQPASTEIEAESQEEAVRIAGQGLVQSAVEGTIVARPKPAPEPVTQPEPGVTVEDEPTPTPKKEYKIESIFDEDGEIDFDADEALRKIAKERDLGITGDREANSVVRNEDGEVIGGTFVSNDGDNYTFDVVVSEAADGTGVGSKLLDDVIEMPYELRDMNPDATMQVDVVSPKMKEMLERRGFEVKEEIGKDRWLMEPKDYDNVGKPKVAEQAELQEELQEEVTAGAAAVGLTPKEFTSRVKDTKVVTDDGKPLKVYRGTRNIEFETEGRGRVPSFTSSPDVASTYSSTIGGGPFNIRLSFKEGASVSPVFLSMKKPLDFTAEDNLMSLGNYLAYMEYGNDKNGITKEEVDQLINYMVRRGRGKTKAKGAFVFRLDDSFVDPRFDFSRDEYSDLVEFKDEYDSGLSLEDNIIQDGLYFDQFIAADAPVTKRVAERLGFDGIIHKDAFGLKEEYEQLTGKKVEGLTQEKREDGFSIIEDDIHITYRPFSEEQVIGSLQQPEVTAGAAPVTREPGSVKLTQKEIKFFKDFLGNQANREELLEEVPSLQMDQVYYDGVLSIDSSDVNNLMNFVSDVGISDGLGTVPPRLKTSKFYKPFFDSQPEVTAGAAPVGTSQTFQQPLPTGELPTSINVKESNDIALDSRPTYDRVQAVESTVTKTGKLKKGYFEKLGDLVSTYDFFPEGSKRGNTKAKVDEFVDFVERNVLYLYDTMDAKIRERTKLWYDGANHIAKGFANRYGISQDEAAGVLAVLSPQKDWYQNVSLAERVLDAWYNRDSIPAWGSEMDATAARIWKAKDKLLIDDIRGKKLNELSDPMEQAAWTRTYDETFNSREFAIITPEGGILPPSGNKIGWGSNTEIAKTFKILNNLGDSQALSDALGKMHKVRNFYNNIAYPNSANGYATMDTHAIAAGMFFPVGGNNPITASGLGGSPVSGPNGLYGTYPLFLEGYTRAAKKRGVLPREMQSITWEQIRTLFTNKSKPKLDFASKTWESYSKGDITYEEAIQKIITNHEGFGEPTWVRSSAGLDVFQGHPTYQGPLSRTGIPGPELQVGTAGSGRTSRTARDVQAGPEVTAQAAPVEPGDTTEIRSVVRDAMKIRVINRYFTETLVEDGVYETGSLEEINEKVSDFALLKEAEYLLDFADTPQEEGKVQSLIDTLKAIRAEDTRPRTKIDEEIEAFAPFGKSITSREELRDFVFSFSPIAEKLGFKIKPRRSGHYARFSPNNNAVEIVFPKLYRRISEARDLQGGGRRTGTGYVTALMREEIVHGTVEQVLIKKGIKDTQAWYEQLGRDLTQAQRDEVNDVYDVEEGYEGIVDYGYGVEYARMIIQRGLYGNVTEAFTSLNKGTAYDKMVRLLKSVQAYITKALKGEVTTNPEAAGVIMEAARLLQSVDPEARLVNQKVVNDSLAYSQDVNPNAVVTSEQVAESGKPPSEKKLNINFARKYLLTVSSLLNSIHPRLKKLIRDYYGAIQGEVLDYQKRVAPFFKKYRGIKNAEDRKRLKQLLSYSPVEQEGVDPLIEERDALLRKYDLFNDYQLEIRPVLNELYNRLGNEGIMIGFLEQYFPRSIKDLDKVKNRAGKELRDAFREFIKARNERIETARKNIEAGNPQSGDVQLSKETTIQIGNEKTAALEAQQWDQFTRGFNAEGRRNLPGNFLSRTEELNVIPENLLDAYEDPGAAMERYIYNAVTAIQTTRLMGSKFANVPEGLKVPPASELGLLIQELRANGEISMEDADGTVPDIFAMILSPMQVENMFFQLARTFGYGTLLVEFTSTLSQLYDLPFIMLDNGIFGTAVAMFGPRLKGDDFGIDVNQVSAEFAADNRVLEKAVRLGLRATGFTKLDQVMKETNMTANYNRYRKLARGYFKDRNSANSKKFVAELTSMGYSEQEQTQLIADLKKGDRDSAYIRTLLFNKLSETQPLTKAEMALGIVGNPNLRFTVAMKSFMIKQLNFVKDRMVNEFIDGVRTGDAKKIRKASNDMALLMTFMLLIGLPVDALKDFLAGRLGYMSDYLFNGTFRIAGISRYTAYQFKKEGAGQAAFDYVTPVAIQQFVDMTSEVGRVARGERAITESKFVTLLPFSDVINRIFGFQQGRERKEYMRRVREGERPFIVPPGAL